MFMLNPRLVTAHDDHQLSHTEPPMILRLASNSLSTRCSRLLCKSQSNSFEIVSKWWRWVLVERALEWKTGGGDASRLEWIGRGSLTR